MINPEMSQSVFDTCCSSAVFFIAVWHMVGCSKLIFCIWRSCSARLVFMLYFLKIVVEYKALGPPHVLKLWFFVNMGMLPVNTIAVTNHFFLAVRLY